ncbi:MAG: transcription termination/antitermination protein NusG [Planctomycetes bacterium]|nr:transcription termination/antitermination protein NusG [Planctomycetota bacterium]
MHRWFFVRCQSGCEDSVRKQVEMRVKLKGLQDVVPQVLVPFERVTDLKSGKKRIVNKKLYPGYLMVQADLDDSEDERARLAQAVVRETARVGDFLGPRGEPVALSDIEVTNILSRMSDTETRPQVNIGLQKGDMVKIKSGAFDGFDGAVDEVNTDKGTVKVIVTIFGRPTPVELEYWEVESL